MQCPVDGTTLVMTDRSGVEIDYCPACRGVWLDRGELDKILERSASVAPSPQLSFQQPERGYDDRGHDGRSYDDRGRRHKKKEGLGGMLGDIFDF